VTCLQGTSGISSQICGPAGKPVKENQAITIRGELRALKNTDSRNINAIVSFDSSSPKSAGSITSVDAISLGPLVGRSTPTALFLTYKDLILPLVIAVFGWILTSRQAKIETQRTQVGETWNSLLPISHKLALEYYMPMMKVLLRVFEDTKEFTIAPAAVPPQPTEAGLSVFFHTMLFWWRFKRTVDKAGAIYFKNRTGEKLVLAAFHEFRVLYKGQGNERFEIERRFKAINKVITRNMEFPEFKAAFDKAPRTAIRDAFDSGWVDFVGWYSNEKKRQRSLDLFEIFKLVLDFETNRPYQKWYNTPQSMKLKKDQIAVIMSLAENRSERREFRKYMRAAKRGKPD
jgi:hypothetical protein